MLQPCPYPSPLAPHPEQVLQIFAAKWIVAQDGITSTPLRIDRMRLVLLGKYGHETEEKKTPLVRVRRDVRSPSRDLHPSPPPTPVALPLALAVPTTLGELSQHLRSGAQPCLALGHRSGANPNPNPHPNPHPHPDPSVGPPAGSAQTLTLTLTLTLSLTLTRTLALTR